MLYDHEQQRIELILAWLFPVTYLIHVAEEYWAGVTLAPSASNIRGANLTPTQFLILHGFACLLILAGMYISHRLRFRAWLLACLGTVVLINGLFHVYGGFKLAGYNPGLASGLLIWIPFGLIALICLKQRLRPRKYLLAVSAGVLINVVVLWLAHSGRRLFEG